MFLFYPNPQLSIISPVGDAKAKYEDQIKDIQAKIGGAKDKIEDLKGKGKDILGKFGS